MKIIDYNVQTGNITEREMTDEEITQMELVNNEMNQETQSPTLEERLAATETKVVKIEEAIDALQI